MNAPPSETASKTTPAPTMPQARIVTETGQRTRVFLDNLEVPSVEAVKIETLVGTKGPRLLRLTVVVESISIEEVRSGIQSTKQTIP